MCELRGDGMSVTGVPLVSSPVTRSVDEPWRCGAWAPKTMPRFINKIHRACRLCQESALFPAHVFRISESSYAVDLGFSCSLAISSALCVYTLPTGLRCGITSQTGFFWTFAFDGNLYAQCNRLWLRRTRLRRTSLLRQTLLLSCNARNAKNFG